MKTGELRATASTLAEELGWRWPLTLIKAIRRGNAIFKGTHWSHENGAETEFARRIAFGSGLYSTLKEEHGQPRALWITRRILVPTGCREQLENLRILDLAGRPPWSGSGHSTISWAAVASASSSRGGSSSLARTG